MRRMWNKNSIGNDGGKKVEKEAEQDKAVKLNGLVMGG